MKLRIAMLALIGAMGVGAASFAIASPLLTAEPIEAAATWDYTSAINYHNNGNKDSLFSNLRGRLSADPGTSYSGLWGVYEKVYVKDDGKMKDYYSDISNFKPSDHGSGSSEGGKFNREHSIPKSWWGGATTNQGCDPIIVIPTDCIINSMRSNYPFGEVSSVSKQSKTGYSKLGYPASGAGYSGLVFEPNDEVKGDLARITFYAITKYQAAYGWTKGNGGSTFSNNESKNFGLTDYAVNLLTKWHNLDKPDAWERTVNDRLEAEIKLRNPYIDHPEFVSTLWSSGTHYVPGEGEDIPVGSVSINPSSYSGDVGDTFKISATSSAGTNITWSKDSSAVSLSSTSSKSGDEITVTCLSEGNSTIYASTVIEGKTVKATCSVKVFTPLDDLYYEGSPVVTEYWEGDDFDPTGIQVYAVNGKSETEVTSEVIWDDLEVGDTEATGHYGDLSVVVPGIMVLEESSGGEATGGTITLGDEDFAKLTTTDGAQTITKDDVSFTGKLKKFTNSDNHYLWLTGGSGFIYNTSSLGNIKKITIAYASGGSASAYQHFSFGTSALTSYSTAATNGGTLKSSAGNTSGEMKPSGTGTYGFFNISVSNKNLQAVSITIETEAGSDAVTAFASDFLHSFTCDPTGATAPTFGDNISWSGLSSAFAFLTTDEQAQFKNGVADPSGSVLGRCLARYDYLVGKYGYENFMDRNVQSLALNYTFGLSENSPNLAIIVAVVLGASIAGVGGYLLIKKSSSKKRKD